MEDIGIVKLGHQKKILLAIKRVKDIISGKWNPGGINAYQQQVSVLKGNVMMNVLNSPISVREVNFIFYKIKVFM